MNKKFILIVGIIIVAAVTIFVINDNDNTPVQNQEEAQNIKELVKDYSLGERQAESASITSEELIVTESDDTEEAYPLPEDEFFVSIAPFVNETHPCEIHSLTGCQGEMAEEEFDVYIEDEEGNIVVDDKLQSEANGFIDLWLPRDKTYNVTISNDGKIAESQISTFEGDNTCVTTIQLTDEIV
ncbi:CueP family metal-binding protein [Oceanobacillus halotolerans]|uniref:CueP family metal-binding protein n=1 Tax=Oceanobacillus halotolerans TaxID=2663380 RepID=UPI0013D943F9|nr:CueP family metal-binding protein [Oceanobacillus halotolerans]